MVNTMKKIVLILIFIAGSFTQIEAQQFQRSGMGQYDGIQNLIVEHGDDLQLTDAQTKDLIALSLERREGVQRNVRMMRSDRGVVRENRESGRRGNSDRSERRVVIMGERSEQRSEIQQKIHEILTEEQLQVLQDKKNDRADKAHEYRMLRHELMVEKAGIDNEKSDAVLSLLNQQSENRLNMEKMHIVNSEMNDSEAMQNHFEQMQETMDELKQILTVAEYENLQEYMGMRQLQNRETDRRIRVRNR